MSYMRYEPIQNSFYQANRSALLEHLEPNSLVIIHSNDVFPTNADGTLPHHQNTNFFYLTGIDQEESILLLSKSTQGNQEFLFLRETNEQIAIWEGSRLSKHDAEKLSGIENIAWTTEYETTLNKLMPHASHVYLEQNNHPRQNNPVQTRNARYAEAIQIQYPEKTYLSLYTHLSTMRQIKKAPEIHQLQKACNTTCIGFLHLLKHIKPGMGEWEIEAEMSYSFLKNRSRWHAFAPIIASGANACILHYIENNQYTQDGDLILIDFGAEYGNYNGDITRSIPVNGKFSERQRAVYDAVLRIHRFAATALKVGTLKSEYERQVRCFAAQELLQLKLISQAEIDENPLDPPAVRRYYMHGCSHFLGLDVHDVGESDPIIQAGMVFTIEPGIYIKAEGIGIRLENDFLIGEQHNTNLTESAPIEADEIEALMAK